VSSQPLAEVIGANCKRIRAEIGVTQDGLARSARRIGLRWNAAKVGNFEAGRSAPTFATVLAVTLALQMTLEDVAKERNESPDWGVTLALLVRGEGDVAITDSISVPAAQLEAVCRGRNFTLGDPQYLPLLGSSFGPEAINAMVTQAREALREREIEAGVTLDELTAMLQRSGLTEDRLARRLRIKPAELAAASFRVWQSTFSEERDRRAGPHANQQKKGRISRELRAELEKALADGDDQ
jgi:transcriptional regulator with XRE-family HTH domain